VTHAGPVARAAELAALGHGGPLDDDLRDELVAALDHDPEPRVRAAALGALVRARATCAPDAWCIAVRDGSATVRRRAADLAPVTITDVEHAEALLQLLDDRDVTVVEAAAWAAGELGDTARAAGAVPALGRVVREHTDPLAREAAVAALGALGDPAALPVILTACHDRPAVRRRAVLALAPFDGPDVDAAVTAALDDRDWQVRQAAEDLQRGTADECAETPIEPLARGDQAWYEPAPPSTTRR
jgi:HEAT repeat protein